MTKEEKVCEKQSIHKWEKAYKIKILFMLPGKKNKKLSKEKFVEFAKDKHIQFEADYCSTTEKLFGAG